MRRKAGVSLLGLLVSCVIAACVYFPLAAIHDNHDADVRPPMAPGPVILSDEFPVDQSVLEAAIQEP